jgi:hypothetical protein
MNRLKRLGLVALMAFLALNVWTGSPLLSLWIGSRVQGSASQPSMTAFVAVLGCLIAFSFVIYQALKRLSHAYREATGTLPTVRTHAPWLRSLRGERPDYIAAARVSGAERIVVVSVIVAAVIFEFWFFFLSGSSIGGSSGR